MSNQTEEIEKIKPRYHSEKCPVCEGSGKVFDPAINRKRDCHGCKSKGWVFVPNYSNEEWERIKRSNG